MHNPQHRDGEDDGPIPSAAAFADSISTHGLTGDTSLAPNLKPRPNGHQPQMSHNHNTSNL